MVDLGGLGVPTDPWDETSYSHEVRRFQTAMSYQQSSVSVA